MNNYEALISMGEEELAVEAYCVAEISGFYFFPETLKDAIRNSVREYLRKTKTKHEGK